MKASRLFKRTLVVITTGALWVGLSRGEVHEPPHDPLLQTGQYIYLADTSLRGAVGTINDAYGVPVCLEYYSDTIPIRIAIRVTQDMTLSNALGIVCQQMGPSEGYEVVRNRSTQMLVLVPMQRAAKDPSYLLVRHVQDFRVSHKTVKEVHQQLRAAHLVAPWRMVGSVILASSDSPTRFALSPMDRRVTDISVTASNVTLRELLNMTVSQMTNAYWEAGVSGTNCYLNINWIVPQDIH